MTYEAQKFIDDTPDIEHRLRLSSLLQNTSPAVAQGSGYPEAKAGDFLLAFEDGGERLAPRAKGVLLTPVAAAACAVEWPPGRESRGAPIDHHDAAPLDAQWIEGPDGRKSCRRPNGNRIERTIYLHALVDGQQVTFAFARTAYNVAQAFARDADKIRVTVAGETVRVCGGLWRMTSVQERDGANSWYSPRFEKLGVLGEPNGPTLDVVRAAKALRFEFKAEEAKRKAERASLSAVTPTPRLVGSTTFTSGIERPQAWADQTPTAASADPVDDLPF